MLDTDSVTEASCGTQEFEAAERGSQGYTRKGIGIEIELNGARGVAHPLQRRVSRAKQVTKESHAATLRPG